MREQSPALSPHRTERRCVDCNSQHASRFKLYLSAGGSQGRLLFFRRFTVERLFQTIAAFLHLSEKTPDRGEQMCARPHEASGPRNESFCGSRSALNSACAVIVQRGYAHMVDAESDRLWRFESLGTRLLLLWQFGVFGGRGSRCLLYRMMRWSCSPLLPKYAACGFCECTPPFVRLWSLSVVMNAASRWKFSFTLRPTLSLRPWYPKADGGWRRLRCSASRCRGTITPVANLRN
jgi:hypothetical protein